MQPGISEKVKSLRLTFSSAALMGQGGGESYLFPILSVGPGSL